MINKKENSTHGNVVKKNIEKSTRGNNFKARNGSLLLLYENIYIILLLYI